MKPDKLAEDHMGIINKTVALILEVKNPSKTIPSSATLEMYKETPIFITLNITDEAIAPVSRKLLGALTQEAWTQKHYRCGF